MLVILIIVALVLAALCFVGAIWIAELRKLKKLNESTGRKVDHLGQKIKGFGGDLAEIGEIQKDLKERQEILSEWMVRLDKIMKELTGTSIFEDLDWLFSEDDEVDNSTSTPGTGPYDLPEGDVDGGENPED